MSKILDYLWHLADVVLTALLDAQPIPTVVH
jgi:hypothetical protein